MSKPKRQPRKQFNPLDDEAAPPVERQYFSIGMVCQLIQQPPQFVLKLMKASGVEFAWTQDAVGYLRGDDLQKMYNWLADSRENIEGQYAAAPNN